MKHLTSVALLLLSGVAVAQVPPLGLHSPVGLINQIQPSGSPGNTLPGEQRVAARTAVGDAAPSALSSDGVKIGRRLWWMTDSTKVGVTPIEYHNTGTTAIVFAVCSFVFTTIQFPGAATGFDMVFVDPTTVVTASPFFTETALTTPMGPATVPSGGYDRFWLYWDVPNNPSLINAIVDMQALRVDPSNFLIYLSNELLVMLVP